jgi:hypothetical protein
MFKNMAIGATIRSVLAALIGVQTEQNRTKDFSEGKASHFIIAGILAVIIFIVVLISIVTMVLPN